MPKILSFGMVRREGDKTTWVANIPGRNQCSMARKLELAFWSFIVPPNLHLLTPELIHAPERIGILEFKIVPQGE
jgi:hypothetical protein